MQSAALYPADWRKQGKKLKKMRVDDFEAFLYTAKGLVTNCVCHCLGAFSMHIEIPHVAIGQCDLSMQSWPDPCLKMSKLFFVFLYLPFVPHNWGTLRLSIYDDLFFSIAAISLWQWLWPTHVKLCLEVHTICLAFEGSLEFTRLHTFLRVF